MRSCVCVRMHADYLAVCDIRLVSIQCLHCLAWCVRLGIVRNRTYTSWWSKWNEISVCKVGCLLAASMCGKNLFNDELRLLVLVPALSWICLSHLTFLVKSRFPVKWTYWIRTLVLRVSGVVDPFMNSLSPGPCLRSGCVSTHYTIRRSQFHGWFTGAWTHLLDLLVKDKFDHFKFELFQL